MLYNLAPLAEFYTRFAPAGSIEEPRSHEISTWEILLAGLSALAIFTVLLLRLPYRSPVTNILLSTFALGSLYFYLRLRLNIRVPAAMILSLGHRGLTHSFLFAMVLSGLVVLLFFQRI